eukprot:5936773-Heterocapsa_arctica.AAC.1
MPAGSQGALAAIARVVLEADLCAPVVLGVRERRVRWLHECTHAAGDTLRVWFCARGRVRIRPQPVGSPFD